MRNKPQFIAAVARSDDLRRYSKNQSLNESSKIQEEDQGQNYFYNPIQNKNVRRPPLQVDLYESGLNVQPPAVVSQDDGENGHNLAQDVGQQNQENKLNQDQDQEEGKGQQKDDELMKEARQMHEKNVPSGLKSSTSQEYYQDEFQKIQTQRKMGIETVPEQGSKDQESGLATLPNTKIDNSQPQYQESQDDQEEKIQEKQENDQLSQKQNTQQSQEERKSQTNKKESQFLVLPLEQEKKSIQEKNLNAEAIENLKLEQEDKIQNETSNIPLREPIKDQNIEKSVSSKNYQNQMPAVPFDQGVSTIKPANTSIQNTRENLILDSMIERNQDKKLNASSPNIDKNQLQNISQKYPESVPLSPQQKQQSQIDLTQFKMQNQEQQNSQSFNQNSDRKSDTVGDSLNKHIQFQDSKKSQLQVQEPNNQDDGQDDNNSQLPHLIADQLQFSPSQQTPVNVNHKTKTVPCSVIQKSISIQKKGITPPQYGDLSHQELAHIQQLSYQPSPTKNPDDEGVNEDSVGKSGDQDQIIAQSYADRDLPSDLRKDQIKNEPHQSTEGSNLMKYDVKSEQSKTAILVEEEQKH